MTRPRALSHRDAERWARTLAAAERAAAERAAAEYRIARDLDGAPLRPPTARRPARRVRAW